MRVLLRAFQFTYLTDRDERIPVPAKVNAALEAARVAFGL